MRQRLLLASWVLFLLAPPALADQPKIDFAELEKVVLKELEDTNTPGAAVAVIRDDRVIYAKGFGVACVETKGPVTPDTLFRLGSTTKMFTAAALVQLAEEDKIKLDEPVDKYIHINAKIGRATASQLLSHTAGLSDESPMSGLHDDSALAKSVVGLKDDIAFCDPGKVYSYSNPGYWVAGCLIEHLGDKGYYADQMHERLFKPLGMTRTTFRPTLAMTYPLALGHALSGKKPEVVRPAADNAATWPAGQMFSSANDLSRFAIAFLNDGKLDGKEVLTPSLIKALSTPRADIPGSTAKYGYGLQIGEYRGMHRLQHGGSRLGYGSQVTMVPKHRVAVIVLANRTGSQMPRTVEKAMELVLPLEAKKDEPRKERPMSPEEMARCVGVYSNNRVRLEILIKDGKLVGKQGDREGPITKWGDQHFAIEVFGGDFVLVPGTDGKAEFLYRGGRSLKRVAEK